MYKSQLQNLCQLRQWPLPLYTQQKIGPDHNPRFTATVTVNGVPFSTADNLSRNSKEAHNNAAKVAFEQLTRPVHVATPVDPTPKTHVLSDSHVGLCIGGPSTLMNGIPSEVKDSKKFIDSAHLYKNRLQNYALKRNLALPAYSCEREGLPHALRFRCKVTFQGKTVESSEFYPTIKEAEHAVAKKAWESWSLDEVQQDDTPLYKNLLQEYLQKNGCPVPKYETTTSGPFHMPIFVSKVNIRGQVYEGQAALNKKQAESHAAKVTYLGLQDQELKEGEESKICNGQHIEIQPDLNMAEELKEGEESKICNGQHIEIQPVFTSGSRIKKALEVSSSILQSVIAKAGDLPPEGRPKASLLVPAKKSEEYAASTDEEPPSSPETDNTSKRLCLPSSDVFDFDSSTFSSSNTNNAHQQVGSIDAKPKSKETIVIRPYVPNMSIPAGATALPFSDEKWVALKMNSNQ